LLKGTGNPRLNVSIGFGADPKPSMVISLQAT